MRSDGRPPSVIWSKPVMPVGAFLGLPAGRTEADFMGPVFLC